MNATDIKSGKPKTDGRYVVFIRCQATQARDWVEPTIMTWANDRWHTTFLGQRQIIGWLGPIPVMKVDDIAPFGEMMLEELEPLEDFRAKHRTVYDL